MNTVVAEGNQIVMQEPTVVAIVVEEQKMVEWGRAARDMYGHVLIRLKLPVHCITGSSLSSR